MSKIALKNGGTPHNRVYGEASLKRCLFQDKVKVKLKSKDFMSQLKSRQGQEKL